MRCRPLTGVALAMCMAALLPACADGDTLPSSSSTPAPQVAMEPADGGMPQVPPVRGACIDRPDSVARPPTGELPCELLPPGFTR